MKKYEITFTSPNYDTVQTFTTEAESLNDALKELLSTEDISEIVITKERR